MENAFTLQEPKNISARTLARSLVIDGNVKINYLMGEKFSDWISFLKMTASPEIDRNLEFEHLNAENVIFLRTLNNIDIDFLLDDAVKKKGDQVNIVRVILFFPI